MIRMIKSHILSSFLLFAAIINILASGTVAVIRHHYAGNSALIFDFQALISLGKVVTIAFFFLWCCHLVKTLDKPPVKIRQLLLVWGTVLIGVQIIYDITTVLYGNFIDQLMLIMGASSNAMANAAFAAFYNGTHGFKYIGMFIAILLGIMVTGILLKNRGMAIACAILAFLFMASFCMMNMWTLSLSFLNVNLGIVWTSVIFHSLQTVGLLVFALFIRVKYRIF